MLQVAKRIKKGIKAQIRKQSAINKLLASSLPVSAVADALGFSEPGDFTRNFKRWTGLSPTEYRAKYAKSESKP